jgi:hypothetical protein
MMKRHLAKKSSAERAAENRIANQLDQQMAAHEALHAAAVQRAAEIHAAMHAAAIQHATAVHAAMHLAALQDAAFHNAVHSTASRPPKGKKNRSGKRQSGFSADQEASLKSQGFVKTPNGYSRTMFWSSEEPVAPFEPEVSPSTSDDEDIQSQWDTAAQPPRELLRALHGNDASAREAAERSIQEID